MTAHRLTILHLQTEWDRRMALPLPTVGMVSRIAAADGELEVFNGQEWVTLGTDMIAAPDARQP